MSQVLSPKGCDPSRTDNPFQAVATLFNGRLEKLSNAWAVCHCEQYAEQWYGCIYLIATQEEMLDRLIVRHCR